MEPEKNVKKRVLSLNVIIIAAIAILVIVALVLFLKGDSWDGELTSSAARECSKAPTSFSSCMCECEQLYNNNPDYIKSTCIYEQHNLCLDTYQNATACAQLDYDTYCQEILVDPLTKTNYEFICLETCSK